MGRGRACRRQRKPDPPDGRARCRRKLGLVVGAHAALQARGFSCANARRRGRGLADRPRRSCPVVRVERDRDRTGRRRRRSLRPRAEQCVAPTAVRRTLRPAVRGSVRQARLALVAGRPHARTARGWRRALHPYRAMRYRLPIPEAGVGGPHLYAACDGGGRTIADRTAGARTRTRCSRARDGTRLRER